MPASPAFAGTAVRQRRIRSAGPAHPCGVIMAPAKPGPDSAREDYSGAVIRARGLEKRYGDKRVLRGVAFDLPRHGFLVVTGPNGSGKTTLLRLCAGLAVPTAGEL